MRALITGVTGQDGSYLAELLHGQGHEVWGLLRGQHNPKRAWIEGLVPGIRLVEGDLLDQSSLQHALTVAAPDVVYNLAALTFVGMSWQQPTHMSEVTGLGCLRLLEAIRHTNPAIRVLQASTSEMFGATAAPQCEASTFAPRSPYGTAKLFAHHTAVNYRESYGMHASTAIMFNHESPRRGEEFVTRKVTSAAVRISAGLQQVLRLGNVHARRDWGWAPDYVKALPLITARDVPEDFVLATGETHTVLELVNAAFRLVGKDWRDHLRIDADLNRPADVEHLQGDATKAREVLGWRPHYRFDDVVRALVHADADRVQMSGAVA
jgi:GDPmannose 4,6-dehydratase